MRSESPRAAVRATIPLRTHSERCRYPSEAKAVLIVDMQAAANVEDLEVRAARDVDH